MLLRNAGVEPIVHPATVDEESILRERVSAPPRDRVAALARAKCGAVAPRYPEDIKKKKSPPDEPTCGFPE